MGRIKKFVEWLVAGLATLAAIVLGLEIEGAKKDAEAEHEAERSAEADHAVVQKERERTAGESSGDLYKDLTR